MALAPFRFRLDRVLAMRERAEDEAKEALGAAMREHDALADRLAAAGAQLEGARASQAGTSGTGFAIEQMLVHQAFIERAEREVQAAEMELSRQDAEVDARRVALQEAARERQVLDQLKDKQATAHRREADRVEAAEIDELALAMHRRRESAR